MVNIRQIVVSCERLLAKLKAEDLPLYAVGTSKSVAITAADASFTINQLANAASSTTRTATTKTSTTTIELWTTGGDG